MASPTTFPTNLTEDEQVPETPAIPSYSLTPIIYACGNWVLQASSNPGDNELYNFKYLEKEPKYLALQFSEKGGVSTIFNNANNKKELDEFARDNTPGVILKYVDIYKKDQYNKLLCKQQQVTFKEIVKYTNEAYTNDMPTATIRNQFIDLNDDITTCSGLTFENCIININAPTKTFEFKGCEFKNTYFIYRNGLYITNTPDERFNPNPGVKLVINMLHRITTDNRLNIRFGSCTFNEVVFQGLLVKELQFVNCDFVEDTVSVKGSRIDKFVLDVRSFKKRTTDSLFIKASYINKLYWKKFSILTVDDTPLTNRFTVYNSSVGKIMYDPLLNGYIKPSSVTISGFTITALYSKESVRNDLSNAVSIVWINPDSDSDTQIASNVYVNSDPIINVEITAEKLSVWLKEYYVAFYQIKEGETLPISDETIGKTAAKLYESYGLIINNVITKPETPTNPDEDYKDDPNPEEVTGNITTPDLIEDPDKPVITQPNPPAPTPETNPDEGKGDEGEIEDVTNNVANGTSGSGSGSNVTSATVE